MSAIVSPAWTASNNPSQSSRHGGVDSCPAGLLYLLGAGVGWLVIALGLGFLDTLKFHDPRLLADCQFLSYGRVHDAQSSALLYGFGVQAALGIGLWLLCRLGRAPLAGPVIVFLGALLWNTAVTIGVVAILCGDNSGFDSFEMPAICAPLLFAAYALIAVCAMITFHQRREGPLYPSQWFVVGSLFWFPWIFSTASLLLLFFPVRGVVQASVAWWYAQNLNMVFLGFAGLASAFYFIPKLLGRPLHSRQLASLAFWTLALFGSWGGIPDGAPLPSWISSLGVAGTVLMAVPMLAIALNFYETARHDLNTLDANPTLRFTYVGLLFLFIAVAQKIVGALPQVSAISSLTWFGVAQKELFQLGFFAMTVFGAVYYIVPRLLGSDDRSWGPKLVKAHFFLSVFGLLISYLSLVVAGIGQGILLTSADRSFVQVMRGTLTPLRAGTLGDLMFLVGTLVFLANFARVVGNWCCQRCAALRKEVI
jgi:cytochrome c oxidase cbb3-type subunit 1